MGNRTIERAIARKLYGDFSRSWNREKRLAGQYGKPGYRKPTFSQWYAMHEANRELMAESTPQDVQEYLGVDPWEQPAPQRTLQEIHDEAIPTEERGVMTIPLMGDDE